MGRFIPLVLAVGITAVGFGGPAAAQTSYQWNYSGTNWGTAASWTPAGPPTASDRAVLPIFDGPTLNLPSYASSAAVGQLTVLGPRPLINGTVTGNGNTLTVGTGAPMIDTPLVIRGSFGTTLMLNNLRVNVATGTSADGGTPYPATGAVAISGFAARVRLMNGSHLELTDVAGTTNYDLTITGGQLLLDPGTRVTNGLGNAATQKEIRFIGGGTMNVQGANGSVGVPVNTVFDLNGLSAASGHASVGLFAGTSAAGGTATVRLNLGSGTAQPGVGRTLNLVSGSASGHTGTIEFNSNNEIPGLTGSRSQLFLAPGAAGIPTRNGVIVAGTAANENSPYVILTGGAPGVGGLAGRFAAINPGTGEVTAQTGTTRTEANLSSATATENVVYRPTSSAANATLTNNISPQTVIFEPRGNGQSVNLNGFTLTTNGLMFSGREILGTGTYAFSINGGTLEGAGGALRNFFVLGGSNNLLNVSSHFGTTGAVVKSGGGTMALTGNTIQMPDAFVILNQGALRVRIDGPNQNFSSNGTVNFRGGVLEVDANGGTTTYAPVLASSAPTAAVNWTGGTDLGGVGGGGFAVVNGNLDVNIGGDGRTVVWNGNSGGNQFFVRSGHPLRFGTTQSTGIVTLVNNLALDDGSAGLPREARQIITEGTGSGTRNFNPAVRTRITGVISGSASTALVKLGGTILELTAANTYAGGTSVDIGTLMVSNTSGSATGTGRVVVNDVLIGTGIIAPAAGNGLTMMPNSFLILDREFGTPGHLTVGTPGVDNPVTLRTGAPQSPAAFASRINGATFDPAGGPTSYGRLTVRGTGTITITGAVLGVGIPTTFTPAPTDAFAILDNQTGGAIVGTFNGIDQDGFVNVTFPDNSFAGTFRVSYTGNVSGGTVTPDGGNDVVLYGFTPVPEPGSVLGLAAAGVAAAGLARRLRRGRHVNRPGQPGGGRVVAIG